MATFTFDRLLASAEALPADAPALREEFLRRHRIETWPKEAAVEAIATAKAFRSGKLKSASAERIIARRLTAN